SRPPVRVLSEGASYLSGQALVRSDSPGADRDIRWKTGTSFGNRDAWAVGYDSRHTAVVWVGNLDNSASVHLVGAEAAAPLLVELLQGARRAPPVPSSRVPDDLAPIEVCAYSGHLPTPACPHRATTLALRSSVPVRPCPYHVRVEVDVETGRALNASCRHGR